MHGMRVVTLQRIAAVALYQTRGKFASAAAAAAEAASLLPGLSLMPRFDTSDYY